MHSIGIAKLLSKSLKGETVSVRAFVYKLLINTPVRDSVKLPELNSREIATKTIFLQKKKIRIFVIFTRGNKLKPLVFLALNTTHVFAHLDLIFSSFQMNLY